MPLRDRIIIASTRLISRCITTLRLGAGATWPGEIATAISPSILSTLATSFTDGIVLVVGTNGKTTTSLMLAQLFTAEGKRVIHNASGANLLNGIVSSCILSADVWGNVSADYGVFEVDENSLPVVLKYVKPKAIVVLNLFRDQLDRYGEVDIIVEKWQKALSVISNQSSVTRLVINADDPGVALLGKSRKNVTYFGLNDKTKFLKQSEHATDSTFCPNCGKRLTYEGIYYSHIGIWRCTKCKAKRPEPTVHTFPSALPGLYNQYNTLAAVATAKALGFGAKKPLEASLRSFAPAFGRQEEMVIAGKRVKLFLSKNPAGFNASLRTVLEMGARDILFVLNDRIPDGRDVSWIWDVDFESIPAEVSPAVSGDRAWDMAVRLKYAQKSPKFVKSKVHKVEDGNGEKPITTYENLETALKFYTESSDITRPLYVLATYSAMLEVRKILTGRKIL
jgi:lipid II isoglutaminyl synthase (glutamine-hydrolysing)